MLDAKDDELIIAVHDAIVKSIKGSDSEKYMKKLSDRVLKINMKVAVVLALQDLGRNL
ncbi:hypothetical protein [Ligilactobacillus equi]|uniref:Uncharacterized protein n=1 Tax=Ligilactobacillus equi DSM 15833 = JCM 10991 TaxID=1423740 RepID=A0A0R1TF81_9LACO|nr:hypothetical protein [Ligilactobacillus equi]KRL79737.1 hypothetical protein FC36_GL000366 [Ligilactobacillus equi DSM 15833 = JCM 10991]